jgi:hypothetical protein
MTTLNHFQPPSDCNDRDYRKRVPSEMFYCAPRVHLKRPNYSQNTACLVIQVCCHGPTVTLMMEYLEDSSRVTQVANGRD